MTHRRLHRDSPWLLALLAALVALGPLSVDTYLPAMPGMMVALGTDISHMQLTMSAYLAGFAIFHLLCGPLADRFGRRPLLIWGTVLFVVSCLGCATSTSVEQVLVYRFLQGVGACVGPTLARTVTRDIFGPVRAARALSLIAMLMALAPAIAPTVGSVVLLVLPWPTIFLFLAFYGAVMIALIFYFLPESLPHRQSLHPVAILANFRELIADPFFLAVTLCGGLVYAGLITYLSASSFIYINMLGVPVQYFGLVFLAPVFGYMAGSALSARISRQFDSEQVMLVGNLLAVLASSLMLAGSYLWPRSVLALMSPMVFYSAGLGLVLPHAMAVALRPFAHIAGTASALLGFVQMGLSSTCSALIGHMLDDSPRPVLWSMLTIALLALGLGLHAHRLYSRSRH